MAARSILPAVAVATANWQATFEVMDIARRDSETVIQTKGDGT